MPTTRDGKKDKKKSRSSSEKSSSRTKKGLADRPSSSSSSSSSRRSKDKDGGGGKKEEKKKSSSSSGRSDSRSKRSKSPKRSPRGSRSGSHSKRSKSPRQSPRDRDDRNRSVEAVPPLPTPAEAAEQNTNGAVSGKAPPVPPSADGGKASSDFEAGLLFQRFARNGGVDAKDFQRMWRERETSGGRTRKGSSDAGMRRGTIEMFDEGTGRRRESDGSNGEGGSVPGNTFEKFDADGDGRLDSAEFEKLMRGMLEARKGSSGRDVDKGAREAVDNTAVPSASESAAAAAPGAKMVPSTTHYDETTGVPLAREAVASQQSLGHTVVLLSEAYSRRLSRLQNRYLQELTLKIESLTNLGEGIARDGDTSWVVMIPHVIPGEVVKCKVFRNHANYSEATLVELIEPSPERVQPECPLFGLCGGCQYQHMSVTIQREWKRQQVVDCLTRIGGMEEPNVKPTFGTDETYGYRSKLTPHYEIPYKGEVRGIGFQKVKFPTVYHGIDLSNVEPRKVVDVEQCAIATEGINKAMPSVRDAARQRVADAYKAGDGQRVGKKGATLLFRETSEDGCVTDNNADVSEKVNGMVFQFKAGEFFQNNPHVLPQMVEYVVARAKEGGATNLIDAYCGGGLFCLSASTSFEQCAGIEISPLAVDCATRNAAINDVTNCLFLAGTASNIFANVSFQASKTVVIVDPPRKGCDDQFLEQLFKFRPTRLVYVSCDPSTQARDAKAIIASGYEAVDIQPFDLFPQTRHIENVITFQDSRRQ